MFNRRLLIWEVWTRVTIRRWFASTRAGPQRSGLSRSAVTSEVLTGQSSGTAPIPVDNEVAFSGSETTLKKSTTKVDAQNVRSVEANSCNDAVAPTLLQHETTFLTYQRELREGGTRVLNEAMLVLDIIDVKTQSLLSYISISLAALIFLIASLPSTSVLRLAYFSDATFMASLLVLVLALLGASVLCLSCLNIVGGHTIRRLAVRRRQTAAEYERLVVSVTLGRRNRYLIAHRITVTTAVLTFVLFGMLLLSVKIPTTPMPQAATAASTSISTPIQNAALTPTSTATSPSVSLPEK